MEKMRKIYQSAIKSIIDQNYTILNAQYINKNDVYFLIDIMYKHTSHQIQLVRDKNEAKWVLTPYKDSFFTTKATSHGFDMILQAIYEHTELYHLDRS
ncbi:MAG: hypothetical protein FWD25_08590 [Clostridia bacterium]|nr:hypothetical protein [Clostridia bacterium]